jgi:hypothetical protein
MVPFEFRAAGSICLQRPSTLAPLRDHSKACQEDGFDLAFCVKTLQDIIQESNITTEQLSHPLFASAVGHAVGGNEALTTVFTKHVLDKLDNDDEEDHNSGADGTEDLSTSGLWSKFPSSVDVEAVASAVGQLAYTLELKDDSFILRYLKLISPALHTSMDRD